MLNLPFRDVREVLVLGAHCDDVEIGCGGTLAALARARPDVRIHIAVFSGSAERVAETRTALARLLAGASYTLEIHAFRDGFFPVEWASIKERFEALKRSHRPDVVLTHFERDRHQDHRALSELAWNTFRDHLVIEYEIPKYDGDLGQPNLYIPLPAEIVELKVSTLLESFPSQRERRWFCAEVFNGFMRVRGMECNASSGYAEAFYARKVVGAW